MGLGSGGRQKYVVRANIINHSQAGLTLDTAPHLCPSLSEAEGRPEGSGGLAARAKVIRLEIRALAGVAVRAMQWKAGS